MSVLFFLLFGIVVGLLFSTQASISSKLNGYARNPLMVSFIVFLLGSLTLFILNFFIDHNWLITPIDSSYPIYIFFVGAIFGVIFNVLNILLFSKLGASNSVLVTVSGQMITGILIDHFGWFGVPQNSINLSTVFGVVLLIFAIYVSQYKKQTTVSNFSAGKLIWIFIGILGGAFPILQTGTNNILRQATNSPFKATFITFFGASIILFFILLIKNRKIDFPTKDNDGNKIPLWMYASGIIAAFVVTGNVFLLPILGSVVTTMVTLFGQMIMGLIIDHFGLFSLKKQKITWNRILALAIMVIGIAIVKIF